MRIDGVRFQAHEKELQMTNNKLQNSPESEEEMEIGDAFLDSDEVAEKVLAARNDKYCRLDPQELDRLLANVIKKQS